MQATFAQVVNHQQLQLGSMLPGRTHMLPRTQVLAQQATPAQSEQRTQCHVQLESTNPTRSSQRVCHAPTVHTVAQLVSLHQVALARMAMFAWAVPNLPSLTITCLEDFALRVTIAQAESRLSVIRVDTRLSLECRRVTYARLGSIATMWTEQLILSSAQQSIIVQEEQQRRLLVLRVLILKYSSLDLNMWNSVQHAQLDTTALVENSMPRIPALLATSANLAPLLGTAQQTFVRWASGAKRERCSHLRAKSESIPWRVPRPRMSAQIVTRDTIASRVSRLRTSSTVWKATCARQEERNRSPAPREHINQK